MGARLDHLVLVTPDLAATTAGIGVALGVQPSVGGSHVGRGTANTLLALGGGSYLEIVGRDLAQGEPSHPRPFGIDHVRSAHLLTFAVRVERMDDALRTARAADYDPGEAAAMQRATTSGDLLSWSLTDPPAWGGGVVPFLIDWGSTTHPSGTAAQGATLVELRITHPEPTRVAAIYTALGLEIEVHDGPEPGIDAVIAGTGAAITLRS